MLLEVKNLSFAYGQGQVLKNISFNLTSGDFISVLGANGVGKSTIFKCILGTLEGYKGEILLDNKNIREYKQRDLAKYIAYIPQVHRPSFGYSVMDTVLMGLAHNLQPWEKPQNKHINIAQSSLDKLGIGNLAERDFSKLSGGEQQLVLVARAIAQNAMILIMDEPTSALDYGNQIKVLEQVCQLAEDKFAILLSTHNPQHALSFSNKTLAICRGEVAAFGYSSNVISEELLAKLYSIPVVLENTSRGKTIVPVRHKGMFQWKPEMIRMLKDASEYSTYNQSLVNEILPYLNSTDSVCDMGCGLGYLSLYLSPHVKDISAIDINIDALSVLKENCKKNHITNINILNEDAKKEYIKKQYNSLIFCFYGTDSDIVEIAEECSSQLIIMRKNYSYHRFSIGQYKESMVNDDTLEKYLKETKREYITKELKIEFGQPFRSIEDAKLFYRTYSVDDDKSLITDEFILNKVVKTDDTKYPYYLPHLKPLLLTVIKRKT